MCVLLYHNNMNRQLSPNYPWIRHILADARRWVVVLAACMLLAQTVEASHDHSFNTELESCPICLQWGSGDVGLAPDVFIGRAQQTSSFTFPSYQSIILRIIFVPQQLRAPPVSSFFLAV